MSGWKGISRCTAAPVVSVPCLYMSNRLHVVLSAGLQRRAAAANAGGVEDVGVDFQDYGSVIAWAKGDGKKAMKGHEWRDGGSFYLLKAVVGRCEQLYGAKGEGRVSAAIVYYMDMSDLLTFASADSEDPVAKRVQRALRAHGEWQAQANEAREYLQRAEKQRKHDDEEVNCRVQGGGKCNFEMGTSNEQVRINGGGPSYAQLYPADTIAYYKELLTLAKPTDFPPSLWRK